MIDKSFLSGGRMTLDKNHRGLLAASLCLPWLNPPIGFCGSLLSCLHLSDGLWEAQINASHSLSFSLSQASQFVSSNGKKKKKKVPFNSLQLSRCKESLLLSLCTISANFPHTGFWTIRGL